MTEFITKNYLWIIIVAAFLIFALIGFIVDSTKNKKDSDLLTESGDTPSEVPTEDVPVVEEIVPTDESVNNDEIVIPEITEVEDTKDNK